MTSHSRLTISRGLTLIELLVALAVFSVLGVLTWRASAQMIDGREQIATSLEHWRNLARALDRVELDLLHAVAPSGPASVTALTYQRASTGNDSELTLLTLDREAGVSRVGYRLRGSRLEWLIWSDRDMATSPSAYLLLDNVRTLHWRFMHADTWHTEWPPVQPDAPALPTAVELSLELSADAPIVRLFALH